MVWMATVWEHYLREVYGLPAIAICMAIHKMHVCKFVKWILIHTVADLLVQFATAHKQYT